MKVTVKNPASGMPLDFVAKATGGELILRGTATPPTVQYVCTDSREADGDTLFCAIRGERVDGHTYMANTQGLGCVAFLCERIPEGLKPPFAAVVVADTVAALSELARAYREAYLSTLTPVAVTGSVGKTTTKECVAAVLSQGGELFKKEGNFNSVIGLPLSVLEIPETCESAVLEMGMSGFGEISAMTAAVHPHIAMITNVGHSHMEMLGSREGIARAKLEISESMVAGDILVINGDEPLLGDPVTAPLRARGVRVLRLSMQDQTADAYLHSIRPVEGGMTFDLRVDGTLWRDLTIPSVGNHMVWAAGFAAVTGYCLGMTAEQVGRGLASYVPAAMRQNVYGHQGMTVIEDCYNASPESMKAAFSVLRLTAKSRMIAVLGDMKELGDASVALHRQTGEALVKLCGTDLRLITVGALGEEISRGAEQAGLPKDHISVCLEDKPYPQAVASLKGLCSAGDTLLFKASRSMGLEEIIKAFTQA